MTQDMHTLPPVQPPTYPPRPPLRRSTSDRVIGGVAGGIARWLEIDPVIVRVLLVALAVFGGSGLLIYVIGWLFIPSDDATHSEADRFLARTRQPGSLLRTIVTVVVAAVAIIIFANIADSLFGHWGNGGSVLLLIALAFVVVYLLRQPKSGETPAPLPPAEPVPVDDDVARTSDAAASPAAELPPPPHAAYAYGGSGSYQGYVAAAPVPVPVPSPPKQRSYLGLATFSVALAVTGILTSLSLSGAANIPTLVILAAALGVIGLGMVVGTFFGRARWLVALAIPLTLVTVFVGLLPSDLGKTLGHGAGQVTWQPSSVPDAVTPYMLTAGNATLDLTSLAVPAGTPITVQATVGLGRLNVYVSTTMRVVVHASVGIGHIGVDGIDRRGGRQIVIVGPLPPAYGASPHGSVVTLIVRSSIGDLEVSRA